MANTLAEIIVAMEGMLAGHRETEFNPSMPGGLSQITYELLGRIEVKEGGGTYRIEYVGLVNRVKDGVFRSPAYLTMYGTQLISEAAELARSMSGSSFRVLQAFPPIKSRDIYIIGFFSHKRFQEEISAISEGLKPAGNNKLYNSARLPHGDERA